MKLNPFEQGVADYKNNLRGCNPFPPFGQRWALYNKGYNSCWYPTASEKSPVITLPHPETSHDWD